VLPRHWLQSRRLFFILSLILFTWNSVVLWQSGQPENIQVLTLLLWLGLVVSLEDQLHLLWPRPYSVSFFAGAAILTATLIRGFWISNDQDHFVYLLLPLITVGLVLLVRPITQWQSFRTPLTIALLLPLSRVFTAVLPPILNPLTAHLTWACLYALGFQATLNRAEVRIGDGGVTVLGPCSGVEQMIFTVSVVVIFLLVFPLEKVKSIIAVLIGAVLAAIAVNVVRISLLAYLTSLPKKSGMPAFHFLHDSYGSLLFSLVAVSLVSWLYLKLLDRELTA